MASIRKKGKNYFIKFSSTDSTCGHHLEKNFSLKTSNKRDAEKLKEELENDYDKGLFNPFSADFNLGDYMGHKKFGISKQRGITLEELCQVFLNERGNLREATIDAYSRHFKMMMDEWGSTLPVRYITEQMVRDFCFKPGLQPATQKSYLTHLKVFFSWLKKKGFHSDNIAKEIRPPRIGDQKLKKVIGNETFFRIIEAQQIHQNLYESKGLIKKQNQKQRWFRPLMYVYYFAGLRLQEGINLYWAQIDFTNQDIHVVNSAQARTKSGKDRSVPMRKELYNELKRWHDECGNPLNGLVFPSPVSSKYVENTLPPQRVSKIFKKFSRMANLSEDFTTHSLRHSFVTNLLHDGIELTMVQQLAGHSDITTTRGYAHITGRAVKNRFKELNL